MDILGMRTLLMTVLAAILIQIANIENRRWLSLMCALFTFSFADFAVIWQLVVPILCRQTLS